VRPLRRLGIVLGQGGHTAQTFALIDLLGHEFRYTYFVGLFDKLTKRKIRIPGLMLPVLPPRLLPQDSRIMAALRTVLTLAVSFAYLLVLRPAAVISCGTGLTVPIFFSARLLNIRTVFVESMSRVDDLSITGRLLLNRTDLFIVQWPQLAAKTPGSVYGGQLL